MDKTFGAEMDRLLDEFDTKFRAVEERKRRVQADEDAFDQGFARIIASIVKPSFLSVAALLTARGHKVLISDEEPAAEPGANASDTGVSIHIAPAGSGAPLEPGQVPWMTIATRRYNKTVSIRSGNVGSAAAGATGPRGDYQLALIDTALVEGELLKFIGAILASS